MGSHGQKLRNMVYKIEDKPICTARVGKSKDIFKDIMDLHISEGAVIADVTAGLLKFWTNIDLGKYFCIFADTDFDRAKSYQELNSISLQADCRYLPYRADSLDVVVLDPPYGQLSTSPQSKEMHHLSEAYNLQERRGEDLVYEMYQMGTMEAFRVLKEDGIFIVKCQDFVNSKKQHWLESDVWMFAEIVGFVRRDKFVLVRQETPIMRHDIQYNARKNHSYFWLFTKPRTKRRKKSKR